jgi:hypothetical protein
MKALDEIRSLEVIAEYLEYIRMVYDLSIIIIIIIIRVLFLLLRS